MQAVLLALNGIQSGFVFLLELLQQGNSLLQRLLFGGFLCLRLFFIPCILDFGNLFENLLTVFFLRLIQLRIFLRQLLFMVCQLLRRLLCIRLLLHFLQSRILLGQLSFQNIPDLLCRSSGVFYSRFRSGKRIYDAIRHSFRGIHRHLSAFLDADRNTLADISADLLLHQLGGGCNLKQPLQLGKQGILYLSGNIRDI